MSLALIDLQKRFKCDKQLLVKYSDFFKALFSGDFDLAPNSSDGLAYKIEYDSPCFDLILQFIQSKESGKVNHLISELRQASAELDFFQIQRFDAPYIAQFKAHEHFSVTQFVDPFCTHGNRVVKQDHNSFSSTLNHRGYYHHHRHALINVDENLSVVDFGVVGTVSDQTQKVQPIHLPCEGVVSHCHMEELFGVCENVFVPQFKVFDIRTQTKVVQETIRTSCQIAFSEHHSSVFLMGSQVQRYDVREGKFCTTDTFFLGENCHTVCVKDELHVIDLSSDTREYYCHKFDSRGYYECDKFPTRFGKNSGLPVCCQYDTPEGDSIYIPCISASYNVVKKEWSYLRSGRHETWESCVAIKN